MNATLRRLALAGACLLAAAAARAGDGVAYRDVAEARRCGPQPMKPASCLNGAWVCRCRAGGQLCEWELIGCGAPDSLKPRPDDRRPQPSPPNEPVRPGTPGR